MTESNNLKKVSVLEKIWRPIFWLTITAGVFAFLFLAAGRLFGGEDHTFLPVISSADEAAREVLVQHGICPSVKRCWGFFFWKGINDGASIEIFGITDPQLLSTVVGIFERGFLETPDMKHEMSAMKQLKIAAYAGPGGDRQVTSRQRHPIFHIDMRR
jgi:hypothetical protein